MSSKEEIQAIVKSQLVHIDDASVRSSLESKIIQPQIQIRTKSWDQPAGCFECWIVAELTSEVGIAYCKDAPVHPQSSWGLVFLDDDDLGGKGNWYQSLKDLYLDSGYMDELLKY